MRKLLVAGVLAGLAMFVWEALAHMVLPFGEMGLSTLPNDAAVRQALAAQMGGAEGLYLFPDMRGNMGAVTGPWGILLYHPTFGFSWGVLGWEALNEIVQGLALALLLGLAGPASFGRRMAISTLVGIAAALCVSPSYTFWYGFPAAYTVGQMIVSLGDYLVAGVAAAALLGSAARASSA